MNTSHVRETSLRGWNDQAVIRNGAPRQAYLDLRVHLTNGESAHFVQTDTAAATRLVEQARPERAFARPHLTVADAQCLTTFPTDGIERLDILTSPVPDWQSETATVREVPEGKMALGLDCRIILRSGKTVRLDITQRRHENLLLPVDFSLFLTRLFSGKCLVGACEGGVFLLNPANIVRMDTYPSTASALPGSWRARQIKDYVNNF
jgi:hypothetical protein